MLNDEIRELEERLLLSEVRGSPEHLDRLLAVDFIGFATDGNVYDKRSIIETLRRERPSRRFLTDFRVTMLAPDVVLTTYLVNRQRIDEGQPVQSLRSSIWVHRDNRWQLLFHHGTHRATT